jgi:MerR family transcriptional regulator, light-induced transcriptional regulator
MTIAVAPETTWRGRRPPVRPFAGAMLRGDVREASDLADRFLARVRSSVAVFADLVQPAQSEVANLWYRGRIRMEDEHRAAGVLARVVEMLPPTPVRSPVAAGTRCLLAVMPGEQHTVGLGMFASALEDDGWSVELLDSDCNAGDLPDLVARARPRLVGLSAGYLPAPQRMAQVVSAIREQGLPVLVGGSAFNRTGELWRRVGASAYGPDPRIGTVLARKLAR